MKRNYLLLIILSLLLSACSSVQKNYYQLPAPSLNAVDKINIAENKQIYVVDVSVSDYLNGLGIVYQISDVQYVMANNHLWMSSLQQQLQQDLVNHLNSQLPDWLITTQMLNNMKYRLTVNVNNFQGRYDGKVIISGEWVFSSGSDAVKRMFNIELQQPEDGYDSLVRTLAQGWQQVAVEMAQSIRQTERHSVSVF